MGSSPRVRGKRPSHKPPASRRGLIPACAGKTTQSALPQEPTPAHPRVCGENSRDCGGSVRDDGSSPRVRGKRTARRNPRRESGLIPACAGKTFSLDFLRKNPGAHPRVCGENRRRWERIRNRPGSSPRVRGKPTRGALGIISLGLIPACAGKTGGTASIAPKKWAHPRVCGENHP